MQYHQRLRKTPLLFRRLTGITPEKFDEVAAQLAPSYAAARERRLCRRERERSYGGGRQRDHSLADRLLMLLLYYRTYQGYAFFGFLFACDGSTIHRDIREIEPLLAGIFRIPEEEVAIGDDEIMEAFVDGTEQPINRPSHGQKGWYSGKKHRHTVKHLVVVTKKRKHGKEKRKLRIAALARASPGKVHDKKMYDKAGFALPEGVEGIGDLGFLGTNLTIPIKKPKGKELTKRQQAHNRNHARRRICNEHAIGHMKIWNILAYRFRNALHRHTLIFKNVAGLHNLMFA